MIKIPFAGIELTSQRVKGLRGTSELPGRPAVHGDYYKCTVQRWASPRHHTVDPRLLPLGNPVKYHVPGSGFVFITYVIVYYYYHV